MRVLSRQNSFAFQYFKAIERRTMTQQAMKIEAARAALDYVEEGMKIGIGTGSTAEEFVKLLAERVADVVKSLTGAHGALVGAAWHDAGTSSGRSPRGRGMGT